MLRPGDQAPEFKGLTDASVSLASLKGQKIILYFYPKDNSPGCTREACAFRDHCGDFERRGVVVIGVSPDSSTSHDKFKKKFDLPFLLLSDSEHEVAEAYGVWREKSMYGRKFKGIERSTFVIDRQGKIESVYHKVKVNGHVEELLGAL